MGRGRRRRGTLRRPPLPRPGKRLKGSLLSKLPTDVVRHKAHRNCYITETRLRQVRKRRAAAKFPPAPAFCPRILARPGKGSGAAAEVPDRPTVPAAPEASKTVPPPSPVATSVPGAEVDKFKLYMSAQYTRICSYSCRSSVFLMYSVHAQTIIMCLNNSPKVGYNVVRVEMSCLSVSDSRNRLCATTAFWGNTCDAAGEQDANVGCQLGDRGRNFATKREMCLAHPSQMPGPRREGFWVFAT